VSRFQSRHTNSTILRQGQNYFLALVAVALATCAAVVFSSLSRPFPFLFFVPTVLFSLWIGGARVALFSCFFSALAVDYFLLSPYFSFKSSSHDFIKEALFLIAASVAAWLLDRMRSRSEASLKVQHELLEAAVGSILVTDAGHHVISWNQGAERLYGWTEPESIGKLPQSFLETSYPEPLENIKRQLEENGRWHGRLVRKRKDRSSVVTESAWALNRQTGSILQTDLDVTAQSRTESELKRANRALKALSGIKQILIHPLSGDKLLQQAVEIMVQEGRYPLAWIGIPEDNPERSVRVAASAGKAIEYLSGIELTWNDEPLGRGPTGTALREGRSRVNQNFLTDPKFTPWREACTRYGFQSVVCLPLIVQGQTIAGLTLYALEENAFEGQELDLVSELADDLALGLTTIRLQEQAEEQRKSRLLLEEQYRQAQKMEAIGRLASGISHDFNNLLMVIMAQTELLSLNLTGTDLARTENVMNSARKAADLVRQLLTFSRRQVVQPRILSMNPVLTDIAKMARTLLGEDIEIAIALCEEPWLVKVDRSQFEQVIMNLLVNARDAMPNGGKLTLETANANITTEYIATHPLVPAGRYVMLAVSDTGVGMTDEIKAQIFEPFFTTKEPGKGTGLGLSTVYGIVKQNNGFIWLYSELEKGTCFKIYLPAVERRKTVYDSEPSVETFVPVGHATVLLVEDEHALREVISEFLRSAGHTVIAVESHDEALARVAEHPGKIDLLLTDIVLKGLNGKQLAENLQAKGYTFKVIFMSGYTPNASVYESLLDESTVFLQKPFTRPTLLAKVHETLDS